MTTYSGLDWRCPWYRLRPCGEFCGLCHHCAIAARTVAPLLPASPVSRRGLPSVLSVTSLSRSPHPWKDDRILIYTTERRAFPCYWHFGRTGRARFLPFFNIHARIIARIPIPIPAREPLRTWRRRCRATRGAGSAGRTVARRASVCVAAHRGARGVAARRGRRGHGSPMRTPHIDAPRGHHKRERVSPLTFLRSY